jgi:SWI/SNF-related matrix-associated actin-dependent regulator of chromatin subfamily A-like protein 1
MQVTMLDATRVKVQANGYNQKLHQWMMQLPKSARSWEPTSKFWTFDKAYLPHFSQIFPNVCLPGPPTATVEYGAAPITTNFVAPNLKRQPFPFQQAGIEYAVKHRGRVIVADEMGCGKTITGMGVCAYYQEARPVVIVCPKSLVTVWQDHICEWMGGDNSVHVIKGQKVYAYPTAAFYIVQWDLLFRHIGFLADVVQVAILDEAHRAANRQCKQGTAAATLAHAAQVCLPMSGTPMRNGPKNIWALLNMVSPQAWPEWWGFGIHYCDGHQKEVVTGKDQHGRLMRRMVWNFDGASHQAELSIKLMEYMLRRKKEQVLKELPEKYPPRLIRFELGKEARQEYGDMLRQTTEAIWTALELDGYLKGEILVQLSALRKLAAELVLPQALEFIEDYIEDEKIIVFVHHREIAEQIKEYFGDRAVMIIGGMNDAQRKAAMTAFQNEDRKLVFIGNDAAGEGLTLTAASTVFHVEIPWTPADFDQRSDRAHRIGQNKAVKILVAMPTHTIYQDIWDIVEQKREVIEGIVDAKTVQNLVARRLLQEGARERRVQKKQGVPV